MIEVPAGDGLFAIRLQIDHIMQQESLSISIWGSTDGEDWGVLPLVTLPTKHYCGNYVMGFDLAKYREVRYLRVQWKMTPWYRNGARTLFGFSVLVEGSNLGPAISAAGASCD